MEFNTFASFAAVVAAASLSSCPPTLNVTPSGSLQSGVVPLVRWDQWWRDSFQRDLRHRV